MEYLSLVRTDPVERPRRLTLKWMTWCEGGQRIHLAQDPTNFWFPQKAGHFSSMQKVTAPQETLCIKEELACFVTCNTLSVAPQHEPWRLPEGSQQNFFLQGKDLSLTPNPQPGGPGLRINPPPHTGDRVAQLHPRTLGSSDSSGTSGSPLPVPTYVGP
jgi:hypothetical protein